MLEAVGVVTRADLERVGPALACRSLRGSRPGVTLNLLYPFFESRVCPLYRPLPRSRRFIPA